MSITIVNITVIVAAILLIVNIIFSIKNIFINFNLSDNNFKNLILISLIIIGIIFTCYSISAGVTAQGAFDEAEKSLGYFDGIYLKEARSSITTFTIGFISFALELFLFKSIEKNNIKKAKNRKRQWDLDKITKG